MTPSEQQKHYAINQHALCCKYLDVAEPYDGDGDTLSEAVMALKKDREHWKEESALRSKETEVIDKNGNVSCIEIIKENGDVLIYGDASLLVAAAIPETDTAWEAHQIDSTSDAGDPWGLAAKLERERNELRSKYAIKKSEVENLTEVIRAATVLIAAKGRHNTMLAYEGLRASLSLANA